MECGCVSMIMKGGCGSTKISCNTLIIGMHSTMNKVLSLLLAVCRGDGIL